MCNSVGSLFLLFFTAIVLSAITPLVCYKHPDGNGESMLSDAAILCFEGGGADGEGPNLLKKEVRALVLTVLLSDCHW